MFDYLDWRGDLDFNISPFNPVDNIIFSQLSYLALDGIVPGPEDGDGISIALAVRIFNEKVNSPEGLVQTSVFREDPDLIRALGASRRFGNCQLFGYVNHIDNTLETQFSALCIHIDDDHCFVVFRGTDSSIVGWKEDFNMSFKEVVPSQLEAVKYLERMAPMLNGRLRVGGHSKGGNLAIYASAFCNSKIQQRIDTIYNNDAPGFHKNVVSSKGYSAIKGRIRSYVPQASIIGMLLDHNIKYTIIKSSENGLMQHSLYTWEVTYNDLVRAEKSTVSSRFINKTIRGWVNNIDIDQREQFIEALYYILKAADVKSVSEFENSWFSSAGRILKSINNLDETKRKIIRTAMTELFNSANKNIDVFVKQGSDSH